MTYSNSSIPIRTIFKPHKNYSVEKLCISFDAKYLVTVGNEPHPVIKFWKWTFGKDEPDGEYIIDKDPGPGIVEKVTNNPNHTNQFMVNFSRQMVFIEWVRYLHIRVASCNQCR